MIKLENISVYGADNFFISWIKSMGKEELDFIIDNNLENFAELEKMIMASNDVPCYFINLYELTKKYLSKEHMINKNPNIYDNSILENIDKRDLEVTEEETLTKNLILNALVFDTWRSTYSDIEELNIKSLRFFLSHTIPNGKNALTLFSKIGNKSINNVIKALSFYEEQILRQYRERHIVGTNLFTLNEEAKKKIVERNINKYIEYFLSYSFDFIWGKRSEHVNKLLEDCLINQKIKDINNKDRLIEALTNYMTLEELENDAIENHTLDRFMLKKTPSKSVNLH